MNTPLEGNLIKAIDECLVPEGSYFMDGEWWWRNDIATSLNCWRLRLSETPF